MKGTQLSIYPHYSWLAHWLTIHPPHVFARYHCEQVNHLLMLTTDGDADFVWATDSAESTFHATAGDLTFFPCDHARHAVSITASAGYRAYVLCLPDTHLCGMRDTGNVPPETHRRALPIFRDAMVRASLLRLSGASEQGKKCGVSCEIGDEIAARQIIMRLSDLTGSREPDWQTDACVFSPQMMRQIVGCIDAQLGGSISLEQMGSDFGLPPSHFARKFRQSASVSLNRFINRRRLGVAFGLLRLGKAPLSQLSLELGFASQSHFTRLFRAHTGFTPYGFRRSHRVHMIPTRRQTAELTGSTPARGIIPELNQTVAETAILSAAGADGRVADPCTDGHRCRNRLP